MQWRLIVILEPPATTSEPDEPDAQPDESKEPAAEPNPAESPDEGDGGEDDSSTSGGKL